MALFGLFPAVMRPTALALNILAASFASFRYLRLSRSQQHQRAQPEDLAMHPTVKPIAVIAAAMRTTPVSHADNSCGGSGAT
jgi:hypothetical protein